MEENKVPQDMPETQALSVPAVPEETSSDTSLDQAILFSSDDNGGQPSRRSHRLYRLTQLIGTVAVVVAAVLIALLPYSNSRGFDGIIAVIFIMMGMMEFYNASIAKRTLLKLTSESHIDLYETRVKGVGFINEKKNKLRRIEFDYEYSDLVGVGAANDILTIYPFARSAVMCYALNADVLKDAIHDKSWEQR